MKPNAAHSSRLVPRRLSRALRAGRGAATATTLAARLLTAAPPGGAPRWTRTNHRGEPISLLEGPAVVVGLAVGIATAPDLDRRVRVAAVLATVGAGAFGAVDDLGERGRSKGLRGHLVRLRHGELTTGGLKILGIGATGLVAAATVFSGGGGGSGARGGGARGARGGAAHLADVVTAGALVAAAANVVNLFDLRPGRALKVALLPVPWAMSSGSAGPLLAATAGSALAALPGDLRERTMLGDTGANAVGAVLGVAAVASLGRRGRAGVLGMLLALTLASERVSFTRVIESTPGLRAFDGWGRRPR